MQAQQNLGQFGKELWRECSLPDQNECAFKSPICSVRECGLPWKGRELRRSSSLQLTAPHVPPSTLSWEESPSFLQRGLDHVSVLRHTTPFLALRNQGKNLSYCKMMFGVVNLYFLSVAPLRDFRDKA